MMKIENERHIVRKRQEIVKTEADLVVLDRDQIARSLRQVAPDRFGSSAPRAFAPPWMLMWPVRMPASAIAHEGHDFCMILEFSQPIGSGRRIGGGNHAELARMHAEAHILVSSELSCLCKLGLDQVAQIGVAIEFWQLGWV